MAKIIAVSLHDLTDFFINSFLRSESRWSFPGLFLIKIDFVAKGRHFTCRNK